MKEGIIEIDMNSITKNFNNILIKFIVEKGENAIKQL